MQKRLIKNVEVLVTNAPRSMNDELIILTSTKEPVPDVSLILPNAGNNQPVESDGGIMTNDRVTDDK